MSFDNVKNKLGFGCMRLKMTDGEIDYAEFSRMIDAFIAAGFNYFETAHGYIDGKSEIAIRECLTSRYQRDEYVLADKLSEWYFKEEQDIVPLFESQLAACGVDYFDFYLLHNVYEKSIERYLDPDLGVLAYFLEQKRLGRIKHLGFSTHVGFKRNLVALAAVTDKNLTSTAFVG